MSLYLSSCNLSIPIFYGFGIAGGVSKLDTSWFEGGEKSEIDSC